ncbi:MAG: energy transducer TonB [Burkholderiales bacterium]|nr:energy transducer TonB [Burkholderiales bacterium]
MIVRSPIVAGITPVSTPRYEGGTRWFGLSIVIAAHLAALYAILQTGPARQTLKTVTPLMVELIAPPKIVMPAPPPPPAPQPPKPRLEPLKTTTPPPPVATPPLAPTAEAVTPAAPSPAPAAVETAPPAAPASPAPRTDGVASTPAPITPPNFNAAYLRNRPPAYPPASRRAAEEGRVVLRVLVGTNGDPETIEVGESSGFARLDEAAIAAVRTWKFTPAQQAERVVAAWVRVPLAFTLTR